MRVTWCETFYTNSLEKCRIFRLTTTQVNRTLALSPFSVPCVDGIDNSIEI